MGIVALLRFSLKYLVLVAWLFCALGYPLCASIRAIESKSEAETLNLIAYWISFSAILLFEHAFNKLLEWLGIWCYLKLVILLCLVTNDFVGSVYVYNHIFKPCLSLNLRKLIDWFNKTKNSFNNKERFLTELEKYVNNNGTDALQNLLVAKGVNLGLATKEVKAVTEVEQAKASANGIDIFHSEVSYNCSPIAKSGMAPTKFEGLKVACKDISAVQVTENKQLAWAVNADPNDAEADIKSTGVEADIRSIGAAVDQKGASSDEPVDATELRASLEASHLSGEEHTSMIQLLKQDGVEFRGSQWRCTTCDVSVYNIHTLNSHLLGRKHLKKCRKNDSHG